MRTDSLATVAAITRLEAARRVLGHVATIEDQSIHQMFQTKSNPCAPLRTGLTRYAYALVAAQEAATDDRLPVPVIPSVDITNQVVTHTTCNGRTTIAVVDGRASMSRIEPLDPDSPRDIALWMLLDTSLEASDGNVFGQDESCWKLRRGQIKASDGTHLYPVRVLEGISVLVEHRVLVDRACQLARMRGLNVDAGTVLKQLGSHRLDLWLHSRPWCQDAWCILNQGVSEEVRVPTSYREAKRLLDGFRSHRVDLSPPPPPPVPEPVADWERELLESAE